MYYNKEANKLRHATPAAVIAVAGAALLLLSAVPVAFAFLAEIAAQDSLLSVDVEAIVIVLLQAGVVMAMLGITALFLSLVIQICMPKTLRIYFQVRRCLFAHRFGNPLRLENGQRLPTLAPFKPKGTGKYVLRIVTSSITCDDLSNVADAISAGLRGRLSKYAVTKSEQAIAAGYVDFTIENVERDRSIKLTSIEQLKQPDPTRLIIQEGAYIDLKSSGSFIVAGKTRSGKTTGIITLLIQVLMNGRDKHGSQVLIIDPKRAELSCLPYTTTLGDDGEAREILNAMQEFVDSIRKRQAHLNELSKRRGDAIKWYEANMRPSILFIDEYVALRSILPKKASKDDPTYCLAAFDDLLKVIITTGQSAGAFAIVSIAQASVSEGGLPSMLRDALTTKILFKPTIEEARLIWDSTMLSCLCERTYKASDAWFSSTDGINDYPSYVRFPNVDDIKEYGELSRLLIEYYRQ